VHDRELMNKTKQTNGIEPSSQILRGDGSERTGGRK